MSTHPQCHTQRFSTDPSDGQVVAKCSCGAAWRGDRTDLYGAGNWVQNHRPPEPKEPPLKEGFVSGLSDIQPGH